MLKVASYDIVFQEVPGEVTLALNISSCPNRCPGCHSPHLWEDIGEELSDELLRLLIERYRTGLTCVCFMGGDQDPDEVRRLAMKVREQGLKTAWYSGHRFVPSSRQAVFDYVKTGPYIEALGGLKSATTNQRFYRREGDRWTDQTYVFQKK